MMKNLLPPASLQSLWRTIKPFAIIITLVVVLRVTGALSWISYVAGSAIMLTGVMDATPAPVAKDKDFNYNFSIQDLSGKEIDFQQYKGKTIFLNLWATWCGPCRVEMPSIQKLYNQVDHEKIVFVMLALDKPGDETKVSNFIKTKEHTFPVYTPLHGLPEQLQVPSIPTTFVISPQGKIVSKKVGTASYDSDDFRKFLENL